MKITAKVIQHSVSSNTGQEIITYELEYPRYIHAEFMTHRVFSRNSASSRAIPVKDMHRQIIEADVDFVHYGKNQPGMQAKQVLEPVNENAVRALWNQARHYCISTAAGMSAHGAHKQLVNRVTEPFMMMKVVMTTTTLANWEWLRDHEDAQPEIRVLAVEMKKAKEASTPMVLAPDEWHVPYVHRYRGSDGKLYYGENGGLSVYDARIISASCCAQVSYRKNDDGLEKAKMIYNRLINSEPVHASPIEHQATPTFEEPIEHWPDGVTHINRDGSLGSGNFKNWIQFRQLIKGNAKYD